MLYPQNGDRIVAVDSVTSLHPVYKQEAEDRREQKLVFRKKVNNALSYLMACTLLDITSDKK